MSPREIQEQLTAIFERLRMIDDRQNQTVDKQDGRDEEFELMQASLKKIEVSLMGDKLHPSGLVQRIYLLEKAIESLETWKLKLTAIATAIAAFIVFVKDFLIMFFTHY